MSDTLSDKFHDAMVQLYVRAKREARYTATVFLGMVAEHGGVATAHRLLATSQPQIGFEALWLKQRLDLTMEHLVLRAEWQSLFTALELDEARRRLTQHGWTE